MKLHEDDVDYLNMQVGDNRVFTVSSDFNDIFIKYIRVPIGFVVQTTITHKSYLPTRLNSIQAISMPEDIETIFIPLSQFGELK